MFKTIHYIKTGIKRRIRHSLFFLLLNVCLGLSSCKKLLEIGPPATSLTSESVYADDAAAIAAVTCTYVNMSNSTYLPDATLRGITLLTGIASDELSMTKGVTDVRLVAYYTNNLNVQNVGSGFWERNYPVIYKINLAIEQLQTASLTENVKKQLLGEAKFMRAFCYFYLINLYGDVPLVMSSNYQENASLSRTVIKDVYKQIIADLKDAEQLMADHFLDETLLKGSTERVRPTKWVATALLARVYLYTKEYRLAEEAATKLIENSSLFSLADFNNAFLKNSTEAIWQLQPVGTGTGSNTAEAATFILPATGPETYSRRFHLNENLLNAFESGDLRKKNWIDSISVINQGITSVYYYPYKYKIGLVNVATSEYTMVFRLAEQYLIRAEARAMNGKIEGANSASSDVNILRTRAGLGPVSAIAENEMLEAIAKERRVELFTEWGDRWFNLKRTGTIDQVMELVTSQKGGEWKPHQALMPLALNELMANPFLTQNPGYY